MIIFLLLGSLIGSALMAACILAALGLGVRQTPNPFRKSLRKTLRRVS